MDSLHAYNSISEVYFPNITTWECLMASKQTSSPVRKQICHDMVCSAIKIEPLEYMHLAIHLSHNHINLIYHFHVLDSYEEK